MPQYVVTEGCYVPVGDSGGTRFKPPGLTVTLSEKDAAKLKGFVEPLGRKAPTSQAPGAPQPQPQQQAAQADGGDVPTQSDTKDAWVEFAVSKGTARDKAEAMTKGELVDKFGSK